MLIMIRTKLFSRNCVPNVTEGTNRIISDFVALKLNCKLEIARSQDH